MSQECNFWKPDYGTDWDCWDPDAESEEEELEIGEIETDE